MHHQLFRCSLIRSDAAAAGVKLIDRGARPSPPLPSPRVGVSVRVSLSRVRTGGFREAGGA